jgi:mono/diheme cytochrome c family protein
VRSASEVSNGGSVVNGQDRRRRGVGRGALVAVFCAAAFMVPSNAVAANATSAAPSKADIAHGEDLFNGSQAFEKGEASCASCHALGDPGALGGAQLGPPLDWVGVNWPPATIAAWLMSPPSPTMMPIYGKDSGGELTEKERMQLGAYIASAASKTVAESSTQKKGATVAKHGVNVGFLLAGVGVAVVLLLLAGIVWRRRLGSVRATMVKNARLPNT